MFAHGKRKREKKKGISFGENLLGSIRPSPAPIQFFLCLVQSILLGGSGGVVNSLDLCPESLKSLGYFYFRCVLSSQWKAVPVNL